MTVALLVLLSLTVHEAAHAFAAACFGDPTPRRAGRVTLNPLAHLHPAGIGVPVAMVMMRLPVVVGWARPVPLDPLRLGRPGLAAVIAAGPAANAAIAACAFALPGPLADQVLVVNLVLCLFNLLPIKPLDGWWLARMGYLLLRLATRAHGRRWRP